MRTWALWLSLSFAAPSLASEHVLRVSATILAACSLGAQGVRCTGRDTSPAYRIRTGRDGVVTVEF